MELKFLSIPSVSTILPIIFMPSIRLHRLTPINFFARSTVVSFFKIEFNSPNVRKVSESGFESDFVDFLTSLVFFSRFFGFSVAKWKF